MYEIRVKFKSGMTLSWKAADWNTACELQAALKKKFQKARTVKIWKVK